MSSKASSPLAGRYADLVEVLTSIYATPSQQAYIVGRWSNRTLKAEGVAKKNKARYYILRIGFISLATLAPPVVTAQTTVTGTMRNVLGVCAIALRSRK